MLTSPLYVDRIFEISLYLLIIAIPFSKALIEISISLIIFTWILKRILIQDFSFQKLPLFRPWLLFIFFCFLSLFVAEYFQLSLRAFFSKNLKYTFLFFAIYDNIDEARVLKKALWIGSIIILITNLNGYLQYFFGVDLTGHRIQTVFVESKDIKRISASFAHPNDYGTFLISTIPLIFALSFAYLKKIKHFCLYFLLFIGMTLSLYGTQSRGAIAIFLLNCALILSLWKKKWAALFLIGMITFIIIAPLPLAYNIRNSFNFRSASSGSTTDRVRLWNTALDMIKERPWLGWGLNNYAKVHPRFSKNITSMYPHNCYLQTASEIGLLGLGAFFLLLGSIFLHFYRKFTESSQIQEKGIFLGFLASFLAMMLHASIDTNLYSLILRTLFWLIISLGFSFGKLVAQNKISF